MNKHGVHYIVEGTKHPFCFAVLRGSIGARHSQQDTFAGEEGTGGNVDEFGAVISLEALGQGAELGLGVSEEINNMRMNIRFMAQWKSPNKVTVIIHDDQIIFKAKSAQQRRRPYIA